MVHVPYLLSHFYSTAKQSSFSQLVADGIHIALRRRANDTLAECPLIISMGAASIAELSIIIKGLLVGEGGRGLQERSGSCKQGRARWYVQYIHT